MNNTEITIKGSFNGIRGELIKRILLLSIYAIIFFTTNSYKKSFYANNEITSTLEFLTKKVMQLNFKDTIPLLIIILIFIFLAVLVFSSLLITIKLFYNIKRKITVDFFQGKIVILSYRFPFFKNVEEDKFDSIVAVNIEQDLGNRFLDSGKLTVEYLVSSKVDSNSITFEVPYIYKPAEALEKLLK